MSVCVFLCFGFGFGFGVQGRRVGTFGRERVATGLLPIESISGYTALRVLRIA